MERDSFTLRFISAVTFHTFFESMYEQTQMASVIFERDERIGSKAIAGRCLTHTFSAPTPSTTTSYSILLFGVLRLNLAAYAHLKSIARFFA